MFNQMPNFPFQNNMNPMMLNMMQNMNMNMNNMNMNMNMNNMNMNNMNMNNMNMNNINMNFVNNKMDYSNKSFFPILNIPVLVKEKHNHPLLYCYTIERKNIFGEKARYICDGCSNPYSYNIPSFYCGACDYDLCTNCLLQLKLSDIQLYDGNTFLLFCSTQNINNVQNSWKRSTPYHIHQLVLIKKENPDYYWVCWACQKSYYNSEDVYYCNLCDYHLCKNCFNIKNN